jgi:hypothetical protein
MRIGWTVAFSSLLLMLALTPGVEAGLISKHEFNVGLRVVDFSQANQTEDQNMTDLGLTLMTGELEGRGERGGLFGFVGIRQADFAQVDKVEVINVNDQQGALQRAFSNSCDRNIPESCLVEKSWTNPSISIALNSTFMFYANQTLLNHTETAPFGLAILIQPPRDLAGGALGNLTIEQSALLMGDSLISAGHAPITTDRIYGVLPNNASSLTLSANGESKTYTGSQVVFRFYGATEYDLAAQGIITPFQGDAELQLSPSPGNILREQFNLATVNEVFQAFGSNGTVVPDDIASNFKSVAPILNGVLFGGLAKPIVDEKVREDTQLALLRFGHTTIRPVETGGAIATGRSDFLMLGAGGFYTDKTGTNLGFIRVPTISWFLWALAAAAIVAGFMLKPIVAPAQVGAFGAVRLVGILFHALAFILTFVLWDFEIAGFLGTSLLTIFADGQLGSGVILGVTAFFQLVPFFAAGFLFGLPVRFLVNNGLKLGGLKKAGGIGKGIGNLAIWGLGAPFIPFFLNGVLQPVLDAIQGGLG